ncbi:hypothetical protein P8452_70919 [Trifolium repens]|nr:hypothetical protein P8452_70919 [Trifolium repens]
MKLPGKDDFLLRISSSLDGSNCVLSISGRLLPKEGDLGDFVIGNSESSSLIIKLDMSIPLPSPSIKFAYSGYFASTYCSTYSISFCVIGPDHLRSMSRIVDIASAII